MTGRCLLLTGPPGAGKTSVGGILATQFDRAVVIEADDFFHVIRSGYIEPWKPEAHEQNSLVMRNVADVAASFARSGYFTIAEGMFIPGWFYEPVRQHLRTEGIDVITVILRPSVEACVNRAASRPDKPLEDPAVIERLWETFKNLGTLERTVIDTTALDANTTAALVADRLGSAP